MAASSSRGSYQLGDRGGTAAKRRRATDLIVWTATSPEHWLADAHYDEFVFRGGLAPVAGPMWFKVVQTCAQGSNRWVEVPASGSATRGLQWPAALLDVIESGPAAHQH